MPEDTKAGMIQAFLDSWPGDIVCSKQDYKKRNLNGIGPRNCRKKVSEKNGKLPAAYDKAVRRVKCGMMLLQVWHSFFERRDAMSEKRDNRNRILCEGQYQRTLKKAYR